MSWQPIETAPGAVHSGPGDNGRRPVIVTRYCPDTAIPPMALARRLHRGWVVGKRERLWFEPTHWQPLPRPVEHP